MPRLTITLPKDLHEKICAIAGDNDESLSYTIAKMTELGLLVKESQENKKSKVSMVDAEEHCYKLIIQMNAILKNIAAKSLGFDNETNYNPATGLPMVGGLDINGNSFGSSFSDDWNRSSTSDNSWASSSHSISYDSFNNRYN